MEIKRSDVLVPSGFEVESATLHKPSDGGQHTSGLTASGWRDKVTTWQSRGMTSLTTMKHHVTTRMSTLGSRADTELRSNPANGAGIAAGAGFILGLSGRIARRRRSARITPTILVFEGC